MQMLFEQVIHAVNRRIRNTEHLRERIENKGNRYISNAKYLKYSWWRPLNNLEGLDLKEEFKWHVVTFPFQSKSSQDFQLTNDLC